MNERKTAFADVSQIVFNCTPRIQIANLKNPDWFVVAHAQQVQTQLRTWHI